MSSRETAALMKDVHGVKISHQTVLNYMAAAAFWVKPFVDNFDYELSSCICGDETYVKVLGKWHYIFFIFDALLALLMMTREVRNSDL
jgi:transposase-like protein